MKMILTDAATPAEYLASFEGWRQAYAAALHAAVTEAVPGFEARLKWGHIVYFLDGPVLLVRVEPARVLFGFWQGQQLRHIEPRLKPGGKYEMATLELREDTPLERSVVIALAQEAARLNRQSPAVPAGPDKARQGTKRPLDRVFAIRFASLHPMYVKKAEAKGRTKAEVDEIIRWLTGYSDEGLRQQLSSDVDLAGFYQQSPRFNPGAALIQGMVCGVRVEAIEEPLMQKIRYLDKLIDELAKGWPLSKILRSGAPA